MFWNLPNISPEAVDPVDAMSNEEIAHWVRTRPGPHDALVAELKREEAAASVVIEPAARVVTIDGVEMPYTKSVYRVLALLECGRWVDFGELPHTLPTMHRAFSRGVERITQAMPRFGQALRVEWRGRSARVVCMVPVRFAEPIARLPAQTPAAATVAGTTLLTAPPKASLIPRIPPVALETMAAVLRRAS